MGETSVYGLVNPFDSDATNNKENINIENKIFEVDDEDDPKEVFTYLMKNKEINSWKSWNPDKLKSTISSPLKEDMQTSSSDSTHDYSSAKDILQIIQVASDQELTELDETMLKKSRSKRHKKKYQSIDYASTSNDENDNSAKTSKRVKKASHDKLPLKPANFQSLLKCIKTTNKSSDATKTLVNVEKETVADDSQFNSRSSSLTLSANSDNNDNQSSSTVRRKSLLKPAVDLTRPSISKIELTHPSTSKIAQTLSSLVEFSKDIISKEEID
ncbi:hypothetical protein RF55_8722 [Lasius niger]|uniref:Uncharacterized protein n=1 Tax=Lasius niger TaxID=67767 RepID=A0A0J7KM96_LASNI|nr:hypothetical protein RF55_8722 [Lasius niger]